MNVTTPLILQFGYFALLGLFIGLFYEPLRTIRIIIPHNSLFVGIEDFIFMTFCGVVLFGFSMEVGNGQFRLFYLVSAFLGALTYYFTIGKMLNFLIRRIYKLLSKCLSIVFKPILHCIGLFAHKIKLLFVEIYNFLAKLIKKPLNILQYRWGLLYNNNIPFYAKKSSGKESDKVAERKRIKAYVKKIQ